MDSKLAEMNVAIAEAMGWKWDETWIFHPESFGNCYQRKRYYYGQEEIQQDRLPEVIPKFSTSLDACAEFEKTLTGKEWGYYAVELEKPTDRTFPEGLNPSCVIDYYLVSASPLRKCEAFCRLRKIGPFAEMKPEQSEPISTYSRDCVICPYCGYGHDPAWDWAYDDGEIACDGCQRRFSFTVNHWTSYETKKL